MKNYFIVFWCMFSMLASAEKITFQTPRSSGLKKTKQTAQTHVFTNFISELDVNKQTVQNQDFTTLQLDGYVHHGEIGHPKLPAKTQLLDVPPGAEVDVRILSSDYVEVDLSEKGFENQLLPVQPPMRKSDAQQPALTRNKSAYRQKTFNSRDIVDVENLGISKNRQWVQLNICPIQYLPSKNIIRVYYAIEFELNFSLSDSLSKSSISSKNSSKPIIYKIISDPKFEQTLMPFVTWKTEKGFDVRVAYTDDPAVGNTSTSIRNYLKNQYDNGDVADYVLLVGDVAEIPAFPTSFPNGHELLTPPETHVTDLYYAEYTGDYLPDVYYGRLSASTTQQLENQIEKIIAMETLDIPESDFLKKSLLIAGYESAVSLQSLLNAQVNYGAKYYFNRDNGVDSMILHSPKSNTQSAVIKSFINQGGGFVNYTAHCNWNEWSSPKLTVSDLSLLSNTNRYPFIIGNCCLSGKYEKDECFSEALLRGARKGAVTYIGASNSTYFTEDFLWAIGSVGSIDLSAPNRITYENSGLGVYDRIFHTHGEDLGDWSQTAGEMVFWGNTAVQTGDATYNNDMKRYYWEIYHVFGDPSYMPYFIEPKQLTVNHPDVMMTAESQLVIETVPYAYVGFSMDGQLLAGGQADEAGQITFAFENDLMPGEAKLVVTAQNYAPYISPISIIPNNRPQITVCSRQLSLNSTPSEHGIFGETMDLSICLKNRSTFEAQQVYTHLTLADTTFAKLIQTSATPISVLQGQDSIWIYNGYQLIIAPNSPDRQILDITANLTYNDSLKSSYRISFTTSAPTLAVSNFATTETSGTFTLVNTGSETLENAQIQLISETSGFSVNNLSPNAATLAPNTPVSFAFDFSKSQTISEFALFSLGLSVQKNTYLFEEQLFGTFSPLVEDFERREFHQAVWNQASWLIDEATLYEGKSAAKSAVIGNNQTSDLISEDFDLIGGDSIVFYYKVSSEDCSAMVSGEECGDALVFSISKNTADWTKIKAFYGEIPWTRAAFPVTEEIRAFKWAYVKDELSSEHEDCAWVDYIIFPKMKETPSPTDLTPAVIPDHIAFDVVVRNGILQARINAETPAKATIRLVNMLGQTVATVVSNGTVNIGQNDFYTNLSNLPKGAYICTYFNGNQAFSRKIVW